MSTADLERQSMERGKRGRFHGSNRVLWGAICLVVVLWFFDVALDAFVFHEGTFSERLLFVEPNELWHRFELACGILILGVVIQRGINRRAVRTSAQRG